MISSETTLPRLHRALQIVMGWENCHLHEFRIAGNVYAEPDPEDHHFGRAVIDERRVRLGKLLLAGGESTFQYIYDFGDNWRHDILVESIVPRRPAKRYPVCIAGERSAPPEDVGGMGGYHRYLEALFDPKHRNHRALLAWRGRFDPEYFPITSVNKTLREAFPVPSRKVQSSARATFEEDFDTIVRSIIRSGRLPPQRLIRGKPIGG
ncbi:MAG: plasmid pRiA4b ORF-3 family protein [Bryobacteraceae bacterium]